MRRCTCPHPAVKASDSAASATNGTVTSDDEDQLDEAAARALMAGDDHGIDWAEVDAAAALLEAKALGSGLSLKAEGGADKNRGGAEKLRRYWTTGKGGQQIVWGTPGDFGRCVALVVEHAEFTEARAKGYCALRHKDATGEWPGKAPTEQGSKDMGIYDPSLEQGALGGAALSVKAYPHVAGSYQERESALRRALEEHFTPEEPVTDADGRTRPADIWIDMVATFDDHVVVRVHDWSKSRGERDEDATWWVDYSWDNGDEVQLGEPRPVSVEVSIDVHDPALTEDPYVESAAGEFVGAAAKTVGVLDREAKAGRVLSTANAQRLRQATEHLISVLAAAGIEIGPLPGAQPVEGDPTSTAPAAAGGVPVEAKELPDAEVIEALEALEAKGKLPAALAAVLAAKKPAASLPKVGATVTLPDGVGGKGETTGKVTAVDAEKGEVTVELSGDDGKTVTVKASELGKKKDDSGGGAFPGAAPPFGKKEAEGAVELDASEMRALAEIKAALGPDDDSGDLPGDRTGDEPEEDDDDGAGGEPAATGEKTLEPTVLDAADLAALADLGIPVG